MVFYKKPRKICTKGIAKITQTRKNTQWVITFARWSHFWYLWASIWFSKYKIIRRKIPSIQMTMKNIDGLIIKVEKNKNSLLTQEVFIHQKTHPMRAEEISCVFTVVWPYQRVMSEITYWEYDLSFICQIKNLWLVRDFFCFLLMSCNLVCHNLLSDHKEIPYEPIECKTKWKE